MTWEMTLQNLFLDVVNLSITAGFVIVMVISPASSFEPRTEEICVSAVVGGIVSLAVSGDIGTAGQLSTEPYTHRIRNGVYHTAGRDRFSYSQ